MICACSRLLGTLLCGLASACAADVQVVADMGTPADLGTPLDAQQNRVCDPPGEVRNYRIVSITLPPYADVQAGAVQGFDLDFTRDSCGMEEGPSGDNGLASLADDISPVLDLRSLLGAVSPCPDAAGVLCVSEGIGFSQFDPGERLSCERYSLFSLGDREGTLLWHTFATDHLSIPPLPGGPITLNLTGDTVLQVELESTQLLWRPLGESSIELYFGGILSDEVLERLIAYLVAESGGNLTDGIVRFWVDSARDVEVGGSCTSMSASFVAVGELIAD
ncbi:MAG: hypothetical protein H6726_11120 [Sandaracinaceae bacterium]|nr:hypothetical protein [Sandaracinaceae bacterium]